jgi:hypothetical protein
MSVEIRPPVAIRITRPYATEDEFLEHELETLSRTSVTLLGAQSRPQGVVLRFELVLSSGQVLLRGEGRVVAFRPDAHKGVGGLSLRFTRLDSRSKTLVDKAATLRDRRRPSAIPGQPPPPERESQPSDAVISAPLLPDSEGSHTPMTLPGPAAMPPPAPASPVSPVTLRMPAVTVPAPVAPPAAPIALALPMPAPVPSAHGPARHAEPPPARDALLARLRERAKAMDRSAVQRILARRGAPSQ